MKLKSFSLILVILFFSAGCAGLEGNKRIAHDGSFYSRNNPKITIKLDYNFKYIGEIRYN